MRRWRRRVNSGRVELGAPNPRPKRVRRLPGLATRNRKSGTQLRCDWTYLAPTALNHSRFLVKIYAPGPDKSKRIILYSSTRGRGAGHT
jgi:hypothetical protein